MLSVFDALPVRRGTVIECIKPGHHAGSFTVGNVYKVNAYQVGGKYAGVRIRDDKRERKDFNFKVGSNSYFWDYFRVLPK